MTGSEWFHFLQFGASKESMQGIFTETWRFALAQKPSGRRRADVKINFFEQFELRSRSSVEQSQRAKAARLARKAERKLARVTQAAMIEANTEAQRINGAVVPAIAPTKTQRIRPLKNFATMSVAAGLLATAALPAYAMSPDLAAMTRLITTDAAQVASNPDTQNLTVVAVNSEKYSRSTYKTISANELLRQQTLAAARGWSGPTAADFLLNPPYPKYDTAQVMKVANKYVGVPYVFGGDSPAAFDCSGYVAYVFAQFGIALPHSVHGQARMGKIIKPEDALPGDLVVFNDLSHDGIYAGNGNFYHAPRPGDHVKLATIYTSNIFFVRLGIDG
jgi:cell wall-associated NlpC family hydrolase